MTSRKQAFWEGTKAISPALCGAVPFALVAGISSIAAGFSPFEAMAMSSLVFAGTAQLTAIDLIGQHASLLVILMTALTINLRYLMYSASLAPHFHGLSLRWRGFLAYLLTDQSFAISITAYRDGLIRHKHWYFLGAAIAMWTTWQSGTIVGALLGSSLPASWGLDFAIPLTFLALLAKALKNRAELFAAICAGMLALLAYPLPYKLGLLVAIAGGIVAGTYADRRNSDAH